MPRRRWSLAQLILLPVVSAICLLLQIAGAATANAATSPSLPAAKPLVLTTGCNMPVPITLTGSAANGLRLAFHVETQPAAGGDSGTAFGSRDTMQRRFTITVSPTRNQPPWASSDSTRYSPEAVATLTPADWGWWDANLCAPMPANGENLVPSTTRVSWDDTAPPADGARYTVLCDTCFPPTTVVATNLLDRSYALTALRPGTVYYWQVIAQSQPIRGSAIWRFTVAPLPPPAPSHPQPATGGTGVPLNSKLSWEGIHTPAAVPLPAPMKNVAIFPASNPEFDAMLTAHGIAVTNYATADLGKVDLAAFDKVVIRVYDPDSPSGAVSAALNTSRAWLENYVKAGGQLDLYVANVPGPGTLAMPLTLPGGFGYTPPCRLLSSPSVPLASPITIVDPASPVVTTPHAIPDAIMGLAYGDISAYPPTAHTIAVNDLTGNPTAMELAFGHGRIFITSQGGTPRFLENCLLCTACPDAAVSPDHYDIAFGTTNPPATLLATDCATAECNPGPLQPGTTYYWQVMAHGAGGSTLGPVWQFTTLIPAIYQPDLCIRLADSGGYEGVGIYNLDGCDQSAATRVNRGDTASFVIRVRNTGNAPDRFTITAPCDAADWDIVGYQMSDNQRISPNRWSTGLLQPGESATYLLQVTAKGTAALTPSLSQLITAVSQTDPTKGDAVKAEATLSPAPEHSTQ